MNVRILENHIGLRTLLDSIGYKKINSMSVSFGIAPRINACGRMGHADEALKLLMKDGKSKEEALSLFLHIGALMKCMTGLFLSEGCAIMSEYSTGGSVWSAFPASLYRPVKQ